MSDKGYLYNPITGEVMPVPDAPYGYVLECGESSESIVRVADDADEIVLTIPYRIRPATKEEAGLA